LRRRARTRSRAKPRARRSPRAPAAAASARPASYAARNAGLNASISAATLLPGNPPPRNPSGTSRVGLDGSCTAIFLGRPRPRFFCMGRPAATAIRPAAACSARSSTSSRADAAAASSAARAEKFAAASAILNAGGSSETVFWSVSSRFFPSSEDGDPDPVAGFSVSFAVASPRDASFRTFPGFSSASASGEGTSFFSSRAGDDLENVGTAAASDSAPTFAARRDRSGFERIATPAGTVISSSSSPFARFSCHGFVALMCVSRSERGRFVFIHDTWGGSFSNGFTRHRSQSSRTVSDGYTCAGRRRRGRRVSRGKGEGAKSGRAGFSKLSAKNPRPRDCVPRGESEILGARARTSTTNALATVSSWRSLDRRSPRRRDRSPPCSFRFSTCGARGRWGRGRERTRQRDPSEGAHAPAVSTDVYGNTSWRRFPSGCARACDSIGRAFDRSVGSRDTGAGGGRMRVAGDDRWDAPRARTGR
jgi:hypothetical protein